MFSLRLRVLSLQSVLSQHPRVSTATLRVIISNMALAILSWANFSLKKCDRHFKNVKDVFLHVKDFFKCSRHFENVKDVIRRSINFKKMKFEVKSTTRKV